MTTKFDIDSVDFTMFLIEKINNNLLELPYALNSIHPKASDELPCSNDEEVCTYNDLYELIDIDEHVKLRDKLRDKLEIQTGKISPCAICSKYNYTEGSRNNDNISYNCEQANHLYAIRSMLCHAEEISDLMNTKEHFEFIDPFFLNKKNIYAASIGYATGTDLLGLLQYFAMNDSTFPIEKLEMLKIDNQAEYWKETADFVENVIIEYADLKFDFDTHHYDENNRDFDKRIDVFTLSYLVNEINENQINEIIQTIEQLASDNFLIIINDFQHSTVDDKKNRIKRELSHRFNLKNKQSVNYIVDYNNRIYGSPCKFSGIKPKEVSKWFGMKLYKKSSMLVMEFSR